MDIRKLEILRKVVELKSFTKAAEALQLSQPTISEHLRNLEEEVGLKLVDRLGRVAEPTPGGRLLYAYATRLCQLQKEALQALARFNGSVSGELRIGSSTIPGTYILPGLLRIFLDQAPEVRPEVLISGSRSIAAQVLAGGLDLGLVGAIWNDRGLEWTPLFADRLVLAMRPDHPLAGGGPVPLRTLVDLPLISREQDSGTRRVVARLLEEQGLREADLRIVAGLGANEAVREAVKAGLGIAILSERSLSLDLELGTLAALPLAGVDCRRPIFLLQRKNREPSPVAAAFIEHLRAAADLDQDA